MTPLRNGYKEHLRLLHSTSPALHVVLPNILERLRDDIRCLMHIQLLLSRLFPLLGHAPEEPALRVGRVAGEIERAFRGWEGGDNVHAFRGGDAGGAFRVFEADALE